MSFQTDSMIPIGSLQPSSNSFPGSDAAVESAEAPTNNMHPQPGYQGLPHAPTMHQSKDLGPVTTDAQSPINPVLMAQAPQPVMQQQRTDPFGATPFLPPPPASSKSGRGTLGRYQFPQGQEQQANNPAAGGMGQMSIDDRYAAFEFLASSSNGFGPPRNAPQQSQGEFWSILGIN